MFCALITFYSFAQHQSGLNLDVIKKSNGEELKGRVIKVTDSDVSFVYKGKTAEYVIKKSDIAQIVHSSGRIETFLPQNLPAETRQREQVSMAATPADHHNKIAIVPFTFLMYNQPGREAIGLKAQQDAYAILRQHSQVTRSLTQGQPTQR